jgi:UrcA family protein
MAAKTTSGKEKTMRALLASIALVSLAIPGAAYAEPLGAQTVTEVVEYGDLNLASPAGMKTLKSRVKAAADRVCGPFHSDRAASALAQVQCEKAALASADRQVASLNRYGAGIAVASH